MNKELDSLLVEDIIDPVQYSDWATPVVPVMKGNKVAYVSVVTTNSP